MRSMTIIIVLLKLFLFILFPPSGYATTPHTISSYKEDITENGSNEEIELKGELLKDGHLFYQDIWLEITSNTGQSWKIPYMGGYEPTIHFISLPNQKGKSIFFSSQNTDNNTQHKSHLHSIVNSKIIENTLPKPPYMSGSFKENYTVQLILHDQMDPSLYHINGKDRSEYNHLYSQNGQLKDNVHIETKEFASLTPIFISKDKKHGLQSIQQVSIKETKEVVGAIQSLWYLEDDRWIKLKEQWIPKSLLQAK